MSARIVIVGGGFGGLEAAFSLKELLGNEADTTLIDRSEHHTFIPSVHRIISGASTPRRLQIPFAAMLPVMGVRFLRDEVRSIDCGRRVVVATAAEVSYDFLILAVGAESNFFGIPAAEAHARRFRSAEDADSIRRSLDNMVEKSAGIVRVVVAGGGTEGVEVAGEVVDRFRRSGFEDDLRDSRFSVSVVEGKERLLPGFPAPACAAAQEILGSIGVSVRTGSRIIEIGPDLIRFASGDPIPYSLLIWSGGIRPSALISSTGLSRDPAGWLIVGRDLAAPDDARVFGIGDAITVRDENEDVPLQRLAYHAEDQAAVAVLNIAASLRGERRVNYTPRQRPQLISIGRGRGIMVRGERVLTGGWIGGLKYAVEQKHIVSCLARPATASAASRVPGGALLRRARLRLPI